MIHVIVPSLPIALTAAAMEKEDAIQHLWKAHCEYKLAVIKIEEQLRDLGQWVEPA